MQCRRQRNLKKNVRNFSGFFLVPAILIKKHEKRFNILGEAFGNIKNLKDDSHRLE